MVTIRDLLKRSKKKIISSSEKIASGSKDTYNKVLDTEVDDIKNVSKKVSRGFVGFLIDFYAVILYFILIGLVVYIGMNIYIFFS